MKKILLTALALALVLSLGTAAFAVINGETSATVTGKYVAADSQVISVELTWDKMEFTYTLSGSATKWNSDDHTYEGNNLVGTWGSDAKALTVTNHSNATIYASFAFKAESGVNVTTAFTKSTLALQNAENKPLSDRACTDSTAFSVTGGSVSHSGLIGSISVVLATTYDATEATAAELQAFLSNAVAHGVTDLSVKLADKVNSDMLDAIRIALTDESATVGTVNLTLSGVTNLETAGTVNTSNGAQLLKSLSLPDVGHIGSHAFRYCPNLTSVSAPKLHTVDAYAFNNTGLTAIDFPVLSTALEGAFSGNTSLRSVNLPRLGAVYQSVFNGCTSLTSISLPNATHVNAYAFQNCTALTTVELPAAQQVAKKAFLNCTALTTMKLTYSGAPRLDPGSLDGVDAANIDLTLHKSQKSKVSGTTWCDYTFKSIRFDDGGNHTAPTNAADYQTNWTTDPPTYGYYCSECGAWVTTQTNPDTTTALIYDNGDGALSVICRDFGNKIKGIQVNVADPYGITWNLLKNVLMQARTQLAVEDGDHIVLDVTFSDDTVSMSMLCGNIGEFIQDLGSNCTFSLILRGLNDNYAEIGQNFSDKCGLTSVSLPDATGIPGLAFQNCTALTSVSAPKVTIIGTNAFEDCTALTSIDLPEAKRIGAYAFYGCTALTSVSAPKAEQIDESAFYGCTALPSIALPSAKTLGESVFRGCTDLTSVTLLKAESLGWYTFYDCDSLTTVKLGALSCAYAGTAFDGFRNEYIDLTLDASMRDEVFFGCYWHTILKFHSITLDDGGNHTTAQDYQYQIKWDNTAGTAELGHYCTDCGAWVKKQTVSYTTLSAADGCIYIAHFSGDISAAYVEAAVFLSDLTKELDSMYAQMSGKKLLLLEVRASGNDAESDNLLLRNMLEHYESIPCSLTLINGNSLVDGEFANCTALIAFTAPDVVKVSGQVFDNCTKLKHISMPALTATTSNYAFANLTALVSVDLPAVGLLYEGAFQGCTSLTTLVLPSVVAMNDDVFSGCTSLTRIVFGTKFTTTSSTKPFDGVTTGNITIVVPIESAGTSAGANFWSFGTERYQFKEVICLR